MRKQRNPFKKLLSNIEMNALSRDANGEFTIIKSSTNRKRMQGDSSGKWWGSNEQSKPWIPSKIYVTADDLQKIWMNQGEVCYWFKIPLDFGLLYKDNPDYYPKHPLAPSVDKIDDKLDYTIDNIVICCRMANFGRNVYPFEGFHKVISLLKGESTSNTIMGYLNG